MNKSVILCAVLAFAAGTAVNAQLFKGGKYSARAAGDGRILNICIGDRQIFEDETASATFYEEGADGKQVQKRAFLITDWKNGVKSEKKDGTLKIFKHGTLNEANTEKQICEFELEKEFTPGKITVKYKFTQTCDLSSSRQIFESSLRAKSADLTGFSVKAVDNGNAVYTTISETAPEKSPVCKGQSIRLATENAGMTIAVSDQANLILTDSRAWKNWKDDHIYATASALPADGRTGMRVFPKGTVWEWSFTLTFE